MSETQEKSSSPELEAAAKKLADDMRTIQIRLYPRHRDVCEQRNRFGYREAWYVWFRYVLLPLPGTVLNKISQALSMLRGCIVTLLASIVGIFLCLLYIVFVPPFQTLMALLGNLRIRYTEETVRECFLESIVELDSYKAFIAAGGRFNPDVVTLTPDFIERVNEVVTKANK